MRRVICTDDSLVMRTVQIEDARGGISHHTETFYLQNKESIALPFTHPPDHSEVAARDALSFFFFLREGARCCAQLGQPPLLRLSPSVLESSGDALSLSTDF